MLFALTHLAAISGLAALLYASGWLIETLLCPVRMPALGSFLIRIGVGSIAWIYLLFALACVGAFRARVVLPLAGAVLLIALLRAALALRADARKRGLLCVLIQRLPSSTQLWRGALAGLLPALVLSVIFVHALSPSIGWDDDVYHLTLPKLYLQHGGFRRIPFNVYSHWPHGVELLYGMAMMLEDYVLAKLVHWLYLTLVTIAVYRLCRVHTGRTLASATALLVLGNDVVLFEATVANIDIAFAFYFLMAVACASHYLRRRESGLLVLSGVFCGALAGTKLSGLAGVTCIAAFVLVSHPGWLLQPRRLLLLGLGLGLPTLLLGAPWYAKSYLYTGNPLYPMFFEQLGGIEWSSQLSRQFFSWQQGMGMGRSVRDYLLLPMRVVLDADYSFDRFDGHIGTFWLIAIPASILVAWRTGRGRDVLICAGLYFVFWALSSQQLRFLIAALPLLAIAAGQAAASIIDVCARKAVARARLRVALLVGSCAAVAAAALSPSLRGTWLEAQRLFEYGAADRSAFVPKGYAYVNERTPKDAKIMLLNINRGFFLEREYIADSFFEASQLSWLLSRAKSEEQLRSMLSQLGVTHLYLANAKRSGVVFPPSLEQLLADAQHVQRLYECKRRRCVLYELR
jgi:hypothetical protein